MTDADKEVERLMTDTDQSLLELFPHGWRINRMPALLHSVRVASASVLPAPLLSPASIWSHP